MNFPGGQDGVQRAIAADHCASSGGSRSADIAKKTGWLIL